MATVKPARPACSSMRKSDPDDPTRLCDKCQYMFDHWYRRPRNRFDQGYNSWTVDNPHHKLSQLEDAAKECHCCRLPLRGLEKDGKRSFSEIRKTRRPEIAVSDDRNSIPAIAKATDDQLTWHRAKGWISSCTGTNLQGLETCSDPLSHRKCQVEVMDYRPPTRVIHVMRDRLRLCLANDLDVKGQKLNYATLTHCWGTRLMNMMTKRENVDQMFKDIPFRSLDKTFQDAVVVCRQLKIAYLWIDSLCIIQGDAADWESEACHMGNIYASCSLNIVAAGASDGSIGCFFERRPEDHLDFKVLAQVENRGENRTRILNCMLSSSPPEDLTSLRAWCFQETLLAPRSLYFYQDQVWWECRTLEANETFPQGLNNSGPPLRSMAVQVENPSDTTFQTISAWFRFVNGYSARRLTFWDDRLVALSGVAQLMYGHYPSLRNRKKSGQRYLAGLWMSHLTDQLQWRIYEPGRRPHPESCPSWSWASTTGRISGIGDENENTTCCFHVIDAATMLTTNDPFGKVSGGTLRLECNPLVLVGVAFKIPHENYRSWYFVVDGYKLSANIYPDTEPAELTDIFLLHGWKKRWRPNDRGPIKYHSEGLLLKTAGKKDHFRRVGYYWISTHNGLVQLDDWDFEKLEYKTHNLSDIFSFDHMKERHIITIV